ncbi:MAG: prepilin-type N-terminal cleavage/methylation domain-containing protein [Opitutus sp.]|nr:prepilin-type N-terminal cleavage/methylation domain-containing protein [Opitutus sp.]
MNASTLRAKTKGFTLAEIMIASTIGLVVLAAIAQTFVVTFRIIHKNQVITKALTNTRLVQEHLTHELSTAISKTSLPNPTRPVMSGTAASFSYADPHTGTTVSYDYFPQITYRVPIGSVATPAGDTSSSSTSIVITQQGDMLVEAGDYLIVNDPNSGSLLKITAVSGLVGAAGNLTLSLDQSIATAQAAQGTTLKDLTTSTTLTIQRQRRYDVVLGSDGLYELRWYGSTSSTTYAVLSKNVNPDTYQLFAKVDSTTPTASVTDLPETAVKWRLSYLASAEERAPVIAGGSASYYQTNYSEGLIMPKSGNPMGTSSYTATPLTAYSGLYTTTLGTTTAGTTTAGTTTAGTTTAGTTTAGTTTAGTTTKGTTTAGTTTAGTTTAGTTTAGTTTKATTTKGTTTAGTTTAGTTTKGSTTTAGTTTKGTTTAGTTTKATTTKATTTKGTTTAGTTTKGSTTTAGTTTKATTTAGTTTKGTTTAATTTKGTTTAGTTTKGSTTTAGTTTAATTTAGTTTKATTTAATTTKGTTTAGTTTAGTTTAGTTTKGTTTAGTTTKGTTTMGTTTISFDG